MLSTALSLLALSSLGIVLWQWWCGCRFALHSRPSTLASQPSPIIPPALSLLKPLKGCDETLEASLRSWFEQDYSGPVQLLFGVASEADPVCSLVRKLMSEHPGKDAQLIVCGEVRGINAKVSTLIQLEANVRHEVVVISDADVRVPPDLLSRLVQPLMFEGAGLVNCFYELANPSTLAARWEAIAINADFWSQVLQSRSLKPLDFALGAVMALPRSRLAALGGFPALADYLADDYELGHRIARAGGRIEICPVVVQCFSPPMTWGEVWAHQLRWARTIRVCQPLAYFFSIISNGTLWPLAWAALAPSNLAWAGASVCLAARIVTALHLQSRLTRKNDHLLYGWLVPVKDLLGAAVWALSFLGNKVVWRGQHFVVSRGGQLRRA